VLPARDVGGAWFLANALATGDVGLAVPVQSLIRKPTGFNTPVVRALGVACRDQAVVQAMAEGGVSAKHGWQRKHTMLGTNHSSSLRAWCFVDKATRGYLQEGQMLAFPEDASPPIFPAIYSPTGAVPKKLRDGTIDPDNVRPTADYSWPPPGHWMSWLCRSVNETVDLQKDFPEARYSSFAEVAEQVLKLKGWGEPVV